MPLILICRRCGNEVHQGDSFCQECGLANAGQTAKKIFSEDKEISSQMTDFDWPALEDDPAKMAQQFSAFEDPAKLAQQFPALEDPARLTQQFPSPVINNIADHTYEFSNYQLDLQPAANEEELAEEHQTEHESTPATSSISELEAAFNQTRLHSPIFDTDVNKALNNYDDGLGMRGGWAMVATDLAVVAAVVTFVSVLAVWGFSYFEKASHTASKNLSESAKTAAIKEDFSAVFAKLSALKDKSQLDERQQALLEEAAFRLGEKEYAAGNEAQSLEYLKQVSITSDHYVAARQMIFYYSLPAAEREARAAAPTVITDEAETQAEKKHKAATTAQTPTAIQLSDKPVLSIPVIPEIEKAKREKQENGNEPSQVKVEEIPTPKFSESEISRYNRQLAAYFAKHNSDGDNGASEPPGFKEWLRQGKPAF